MSNINYIKPNKLEDFFVWCSKKYPVWCNSNFPFIEDTFEALDTYGLICKIVQYLNETNQNINTIEDNVQNIYNFVTNYFDNLDVQKEINNKLDSMLQDGTLDTLILNAIDYAKLIKTENPRFKIIAHRGASIDAPENTLPAYKIAGQQGFWGAECDVQKTSDGVYILSHDTTIDRCTNGTGNISDLTYEQIQQYNIDTGADIDLYPDLKIPRLEEYLQICSLYNLVPVLELKETINVNDSISIINMLKQYGLIKKAIIISFIPDLLIACRNVSEDIHLQLLVFTITEEYIDFCKQYTCDISGGTIWSNIPTLYHNQGIDVAWWAATSYQSYQDIVNISNQFEYVSTNSLEYIVDLNNPIYEKNGIKAFSEYEKNHLNSESFIPRIIGHTTENIGSPFTDVVNQYLQFTTNRALFTKKIKVKRRQILSMKWNPKYKYSYKMFDNNDNFINVDLGWITQNDYNFSNQPDLKFVMIYVARADNTDLTQNDINVLQDIISNITYKNDLRQIDDNTVMMIDTNNYCKIIHKMTVTPNYQPWGELFASDNDINYTYPTPFKEKPIITINTNTISKAICMANAYDNSILSSITLVRPNISNNPTSIDIVIEGFLY